MKPTKQVQAIKLAIDLMVKEKRKHGVEYRLYKAGLQPAEINHPTITGVVGQTAKDGHDIYLEIDSAIMEMYDLIDILTDPGVKPADGDLPVYAGGDELAKPPHIRATDQGQQDEQLTLFGADS